MSAVVLILVGVLLGVIALDTLDDLRWNRRAAPPDPKETQ